MNSANPLKTVPAASISTRPVEDPDPMGLKNIEIQRFVQGTATKSLNHNKIHMFLVVNCTYINNVEANYLVAVN